jgi:hypothetical protein
MPTITNSIATTIFRDFSRVYTIVSANIDGHFILAEKIDEKIPSINIGRKQLGILRVAFPRRHQMELE